MGENGNELPSVNPRNNGKNGTYIIQTVRASDAGQYACVASNGPNPADAHKSFGRLELVAPTVVVNKSVTVFASLGNHPYLYCGVRYDKKVNVTYRWYFRGQQILRDDSRRSIDSEGRLTIRGVFQRDNGVYRCDSSSSVGDYSTTIELKVQAPPFATTAPKVSDIRPDSVVLQWSAGDDGNSAIRHFKIGIKVPVNGTERTLRNDVIVSGIIKRYQVPGLAPNTYYQFRIRAVNSVGNSPWSFYSKQIKTREAAPSYKLQQVRGLSRTKTSIEVTWEAPPAYTHNGVLRGYYVSWKHAGVKSGTFTTHRATPASKRKYLIQNLFSNSRYEVKVQMFNDAGGGPFSDPVVLRTKEEVPSSPPRNLLVLNVSSRSVLLQWDDPPQQDWNGQLSGYTVLVREFNTESEQRLFASRDPSTFTQVHNVTNLKTSTQYIISVSAKNSVGGSSYSNEVQVRTTEDVPSAPQRLQIVDQFSDTISVNWLRPREVNGVLIGYTVKYWKVDQYGTRIGNPMTDEVAGNALQAGITNLDSRSSYIIEVAAKTNAGVSKSAKIQGRTQDVAVQPGPPSNLRSLETNATTLKLTWREGFKGNSPITKYLVQGNNETGFKNNRDSLWFDALVVINPYKYHNLPPVIIESLRPFTTYRFRVKAWNKVAASDFSAISGEITTQQAAPESPPLNLRVNPPRYPGELTLTWTPPPRETWNSPFIKYTIELQEQGERNNFTKFVQSGIRGNARQRRLFSLSKFTKYEITMKTVNERGESPRTPVVIGQTQEHVPDLPPSKIRAIAQSGSSISLTWDDVDEKRRNGVILGYKIFYRLVKYAPQEFKEINVNNVKQYTLEKLLGYQV
ncbi:protein sidekick-2-like [Xenia sp. Carnegie-2017]|uniref:protein sidekick-2-like n=1 Tax=Xenia sp. Carnegie-2017 TaxID=2897299 RepID=UPI001F0365A8|nr:protein sidekick-2-like [Xenia sp. Carnegie-2017]